MSDTVKAAGRVAIQYLRMSTEHQRYSLDNQRQQIAAFAAENGYEIVETYVDSGRSGLTLAERQDLNRLLRDVMDPGRRFSVILVLDISRWGRFQNPDEPAAYEFLCRSLGVRVEYVGETFVNDGRFASSMLKHMKRIMAAEYSRELSAKTSYAQIHNASLGYKQGAPIGFGLRRVLTDANGRSKGELAAGERKALAGDRVIIAPGPEDERAIIRRIFDLFLSGASISSIARHLNAGGAPATGSSGWTFQKVKTVLTNELYAGVYVFNRTSTKLKTPRVVNPRTAWVRVAVCEGIIPAETFARAQSRLAEERRGAGNSYVPEKMLEGLKRLLAREGRLCAALINAATDLPNASTYHWQFGGLRHAYKLIGYDGTRVNFQRVPRPARAVRLSDDALLDQLRRALSEYGYLSKGVIEQCDYTATVSPYVTAFGSLAKAFKAAGFDAPARAPVKNGAFDEADALLKLKRMFDTHGRINTAMLTLEKSMPSAKWYRRRFGSFVTACTKAGIDFENRPEPDAGHTRHAYRDCPPGGELPSKPRPPRMSDEQLFCIARRIHAENGRISRALLAAAPNMPSLYQLQKRYARIEHFYAAAGLVDDAGLKRNRAIDRFAREGVPHGPSRRRGPKHQGR